ncbi:MAG TPA: hypothetical protein VMV03_07960 [Spirochaetia bacterium]|nr:hypothetical protein [Spirochaetia bacterium]
MRRILLPYLSAGHGHLVLAQAIAHYILLERPDWEIRIMDAARELQDDLMKKTFEDTWRVFLGMPAFLSRFLFFMERLFPRIVLAFNRRSFRTAVPKAAAFLDEYRPDLVMSTHWACTHLFSMARGSRDIPLYYIYGELGATYSLINCGADVYFTLTPRIEKGLSRIGIERTRMQRIPLVVHPHILENGVPKEEFKRRLGIPASNLAVVLSLGGEGIGHSMRFIDAFVRDVRNASLVVLTGRNHELLLRVRKKFRGAKNVVGLGFLDDISSVIAAADVLAGKTGTGYAMMAIKKGLPLIVTHIGAPNERENMRFVVESGYGWYCPTPRRFVRRVKLMARDRASSRDVMDRLEAVDPQNGARTIAAAIVERLG